MSPRRLVQTLLAGLAAAALLFAGAAAGQGGQPPGDGPAAGVTAAVDLCGVNPAVTSNQTVATVLGCPRQTQQQAAPQQAQGGGTTTTAPAARTAASASAPQVAAAPPVVRSSTRATFVPDTLLVRFRPGVPAAKVSAELRSLGARSTRAVPKLGIRVVHVAGDRRDRVLTALRRSPLVVHAERDELLHTFGDVMLNDADYSLQWGVRLAGFPAAWQKTHGARVLVAVVDTGVSPVPDLAGALRASVDVIPGDTTPADVNGHGTAVAGVIAARANNGLGGAGVCSGCSILPVKVMGSSGKGDLATVAAGIVRAADLHARVIDLSLGGPVGLDALASAVAYATSKGAVVVAAAGNSGRGVPFYPANYPNVLSVAGTDQRDRLYSWSERGSWVRVTAPGCNVAPLVHGGYGMFCGTSSATPMVAGLAALYVAAHPRATPAQVIAAIERRARHIGANVSKGRIDAGATLGR